MMVSYGVAGNIVTIVTIITARGDSWRARSPGRTTLPPRSRSWRGTGPEALSAHTDSAFVGVAPSCCVLGSFPAPPGSARQRLLPAPRASPAAAARRRQYRVAGQRFPEGPVAAVLAVALATRPARDQAPGVGPRGEVGLLAQLSWRVPPGRRGGLRSRSRAPMRPPIRRSSPGCVRLGNAVSGEDVGRKDGEGGGDELEPMLLGTSSTLLMRWEPRRGPGWPPATSGAARGSTRRCIAADQCCSPAPGRRTRMAVLGADGGARFRMRSLHWSPRGSASIDGPPTLTERRSMLSDQHQGGAPQPGP